MVSGFDRYFDDLVLFDENTIDTSIAALSLITQYNVEQDNADQML